MRNAIVLMAALAAAETDLGAAFLRSLEAPEAPADADVFRTDVDVTGDGVRDILLSAPSVEIEGEWPWHVFDGSSRVAAEVGRFQASPYAFRYDDEARQVVGQWGPSLHSEAAYLDRTTLAPSGSVTTRIGPMTEDDPRLLAEVALRDAWRASNAVVTVHATLGALASAGDPPWRDDQGRIVSGLPSLRRAPPLQRPDPAPVHRERDAADVRSLR